MNVLFVMAHPDDEAYGPYGTILHHIERGDNVCIALMCNGTRPSAEHVSSSRMQAFRDNCDALGVDNVFYDYDDLSLELKQVTFDLTNLIRTFRPSVVYAHNISDVNIDHRIVGDAAITACRPYSGNTVDKLYFYEVPASTEWSFGTHHPQFTPNHYVELSQEMFSKKCQALVRYSTELRDAPDARSVEHMMVLVQNRGFQVGVKYAEAFQLVFSRCRIPQ